VGSSPIVSTAKTLVRAFRCAPPEVHGARRAIRVPHPCHNGERTGGAGAAVADRWHRLMSFERVTTDPARWAVNRRMPAASVVAMLADGTAADEIAREHPDLEAEDVAEPHRCAAQAVRKQELPRYLDE
jgi:hypothetical protein